MIVTKMPKDESETKMAQLVFVNNSTCSCPNENFGPEIQLSVMKTNDHKSFLVNTHPT